MRGITRMTDRIIKTICISLSVIHTNHYIISTSILVETIYDINSTPDIISTCTHYNLHNIILHMQNFATYKVHTVYTVL